jgi:hypothetical protein
MWRLSKQQADFIKALTLGVPPELAVKEIWPDLNDSQAILQLAQLNANERVRESIRYMLGFHLSKEYMILQLNAALMDPKLNVHDRIKAIQMIERLGMYGERVKRAYTERKKKESTMPTPEEDAEFKEQMETLKQKALM